MNIYARITEQSQVDALKDRRPAEGMAYHFALFFTGKAHERKHLFDSGRSILYARYGVIDFGNVENVFHTEFNRVSYDEFVASVTV